MCLRTEHTVEVECWIISLWSVILNAACTQLLVISLQRSEADRMKKIQIRQSIDNTDWSHRFNSMHSMFNQWNTNVFTYHSRLIISMHLECYLSVHEGWMKLTNRVGFLLIHLLCQPVDLQYLKLLLHSGHNCRWDLNNRCEAWS